MNIVDESRTQILHKKWHTGKTYSEKTYSEETYVTCYTVTISGACINGAIARTLVCVIESEVSFLVSSMARIFSIYI